MTFWCSTMGLILFRTSVPTDPRISIDVPYRTSKSSLSFAFRHGLSSWNRMFSLLSVTGCTNFIINKRFDKNDLMKPKVFLIFSGGYWNRTVAWNGLIIEDVILHWPRSVDATTFGCDGLSCGISIIIFLPCR